MILLSQWYEPEDPARLAELRRARKTNAESGLFKDIVYLNGSKTDWAYGDFFEYAAKHFYGEVCVVANTDIEFDETLRHLAENCKKGRLFALARWENDTSPNMLGHFSGSPSMAGHYRFFSGTQDSWVFLGGGLPAISKKIPLGFPGCDNLVAGWAAKSGCEVYCPSLEVKTWHVHESQDRPAREPIGGFYGYPEMTTLSCTGTVIGHEWPPVDGKVQWETFQTCRR
jgi:hypothetical protein